MRLLLVEDDFDLAEDLARILRAENFAVDIAADGADALRRGLDGSYAAAILDLGLPTIDGLAVLAQWRAAGSALPVLVLTARSNWSSKVQGFKAGADDFLTKPFLAEEVVLRVRALVRRSTVEAAPALHCGPLRFDVQLGAFELDGQPLRLTALEWRVLSALMLRREAAVERSDLIRSAYDDRGHAESNSLEVIIGRLRRKLGRDMILTVRGRGYCLTAGPGA